MPKCTMFLILYAFPIVMYNDELRAHKDKAVLSWSEGFKAVAASRFDDLRYAHDTTSFAAETGTATNLTPTTSLSLLPAGRDRSGDRRQQ